MQIHELRDEDGNVIHACATASFPLPDDHWIYQEPVDPESCLHIQSDERSIVERKMKDALKYTIQVCTSRGKDMDFDPDAMWLTFRNTLFGIGKSLVLVLLFAAPCFAQYPLDTRNGSYVRYGERYSNYSSRYDPSPPKIYSGGRYLGELSADRYGLDSVSNPYSRYGSKYSPDSVNNIYGPYGRYSAQPVYIYQGW